jgi:hypothetical protein
MITRMLVLIVTVMAILYVQCRPKKLDRNNSHQRVSLLLCVYYCYTTIFIVILPRGVAMYYTEHKGSCIRVSLLTLFVYITL